MKSIYEILILEKKDFCSIQSENILLQIINKKTQKKYNN